MLMRFLLKASFIVFLYAFYWPSLVLENWVFMEFFMLQGSSLRAFYANMMMYTARLSCAWNLKLTPHSICVSKKTLSAIKATTLIAKPRTPNTEYHLENCVEKYNQINFANAKGQTWKMCIKNCANIQYGGSNNNNHNNNNEEDNEKETSENVIQYELQLHLARRAARGTKLSSFKILMCCCYFIIIILLI